MIHREKLLNFTILRGNLYLGQNKACLLKFLMMLFLLLSNTK